MYWYILGGRESKMEIPRVSETAEMFGDPHAYQPEGRKTWRKLYPCP
jgi:hypothetical protein